MGVIYHNHKNPNINWSSKVLSSSWPVSTSGLLFLWWCASLDYQWYKIVVNLAIGESNDQSRCLWYSKTSNHHFRCFLNDTKFDVVRAWALSLTWWTSSLRSKTLICSLITFLKTVSTFFPEGKHIITPTHRDLLHKIPPGFPCSQGHDHGCVEDVHGYVQVLLEKNSSGEELGCHSFGPHPLTVHPSRAAPRWEANSWRALRSFLLFRELHPPALNVTSAA